MTYEQLLRRVDDLRLLATPPAPGEISGAMTSFDRRSTYDTEADLYRHWDANDDGTGRIRTLEDGSIVAFEMEGPGVIWRVWSALPQRGHIRVYLDDRHTPVIDLPFIEWFENMQGDIPPLNLPELSGRLSRGRNSFIPIPFNAYCRVELAPEWGWYYHFTYTRFPDGTALPAYAERFTRAGSIALAELDRRLYERGDHPPLSEQTRRTVGPGRTQTLWSEAGEGAITYFAVDPTGLAGDVEEALRALVLEIYWDGESEPAVRSPLGDFFASAPGVNRFRALPASMSNHLLECRWYMPYAGGARIRLRNHSGLAQRVRLLIHSEDCPGAANLLRFHAKWHQGVWKDLNVARFEKGGDRYPDWPLLLVRGSGRFCGVHMQVYNAWSAPERQADAWWYGQWDRKTVDWWWGEGDEKFFVDAERFPSTFGTGSEDYIGYAWAAEPPFARFESAFACMSRMPIDGNGHTSVSRFQIADNIPFQTEFAGFIEKYKPDVWTDSGSAGQCRYAVTPYWYQAAGQADGYPDIDPASLSPQNG